MGLFSAVFEWFDRRRAMREMTGNRHLVNDYNKIKVEHRIEFALGQLEKGARDEATAVWNQLALESTRFIKDSPKALTLMLELRRFDEAEAFMRDGMKREPRDSFFATGFAEIAAARRDHEETLRRAAELRRQFPDVRQGYTLAIDALRALQRLDEADELAETAMARFPADVGVAITCARIAADRENWGMALSRWQSVIDRFKHSIGYLGAARALHHLGRNADAEALLTPILSSAGPTPGPRMELAWLAMMRGDTELARERYLRIADIFAMDLNVNIGSAEQLASMGYAGDAEHILRETIDRFPSEERPLLELAKLLRGQGKLESAAEVWQIYRNKFPAHSDGYVFGALTLRQLGRDAEAAAVSESWKQRQAAASK